MTSPDPLTPIPAATMILFREGGGSQDEHLMIERAAGMAFAAGALVFPGGRIDADDRLLAATDAVVGAPTADLEERASRVAAVRETLEETGLAVGLMTTPTRNVIADWRSRLRRHEPFSALLAERRTAIDLNALLPFARWCPKLGNHRRFDTRFYIAQVRGDEEIELDAGEAAGFRWATAKSAIDEAAAGRSKIIFPTLRNLERLAGFPNFEHACAHVRAQPVQTISPEVREADGQKWLCIPEGVGYPVTRVPIAQVPELAFLL